MRANPASHHVMPGRCQGKTLTLTLGLLWVSGGNRILLHGILGGTGALGEHLGQEVQPHDCIRAFIHKGLECSLHPEPMWGDGEKTGKVWVLSRQHIYLHLDLSLPRLQNCENECLFFNPPSPCRMFQQGAQTSLNYFSLIKLNLPHLLCTQCSSYHTLPLTSISQLSHTPPSPF